MMMHPLLGLLVTTVALATVFIWLGQLWENKRRKLPPGPFRWPIIGNLVQVLQTDSKYVHRAYMKLAEKYGQIVFYRLGIVNTVAINGYDAIKTITASDDWPLRMVDRSTLQRSFGKPIGIIFAGLHTWKSTRRFTVRNLRDFGFGKQLSMESLIVREIDGVRHTMDKLIEEKDGILEPCQMFNIPMVNIVWALVSGGSVFEHNDAKIKKLVQYLGDFTRSLHSGGLGTFYPFLIDWVPGITEYKRQCQANDNFRAYLQELLIEHRQRNYMDAPESFIDIFLQNIERSKGQKGEQEGEDEVFTDENLISTLYDLFWAGSDTSSNSLAFGVIWLVTNKEVQDKMRREMDAVLGKGQLPTLEDKEKLNYNRAVVLEVSRRSTILPTVFRQAHKDHQRIGLYEVPKDTTIIVNYYSVMMDPDFWGDPMNFRPERFLDPQGHIVNAERVLTFGLGKRNCIGEPVAEASIFLVLTHLVQKYTFECLVDDKESLQTEPVPGIILTPHPYKVRVRPRERV